ncbi:MAG: glucose 1-dehydrogenase [Chloroflexi bacterium]|nr:glucose 1-dehydrogenase [Chloroflexota bacterium]
MRLKDKVAIVTGGGSGIGQGICRRFAQEGARLVIADIDPVRLRETADIVAKDGAEAVTVEADVSQRADVQRIFEAALERFQGFDILVNNAGILTWGSILDLPEEDWDRVLAVNLKSMFLCTQQAARFWVEKGRPGRVINMGSVNSEAALPGIPHYCASKGGVRMFTKAVALDLAPHKINVNAVGPGGTQTNLIPTFSDPEQLAQMGQAIPLGRVAQPQDIADVALFLASDDSKYVTGQLIMVDGGATAKL